MTGAPGDAQYPMGPPERARPTRCRPTRRWRCASALAGPGWPGRSHVAKYVPGLSSAMERHRVPQLGPARVGDGPDHARAPGGAQGRPISCPRRLPLTAHDR